MRSCYCMNPAPEFISILEEDTTITSALAGHLWHSIREQKIQCAAGNPKLHFCLNISGAGQYFHIAVLQTLGWTTIFGRQLIQVLFHQTVRLHRRSITQVLPGCHYGYFRLPRFLSSGLHRHRRYSRNGTRLLSK